MAPRNTDAGRVPAERARLYWDKAQDFILHQKALVEYIDKPFRREEALELQKQVERYFGWAQGQLNV